MSDGETAGVLWGTDHEELGEVASAAVGPRAAIAITRGKHKKRYRYEDPNEDAVAVVVGPRATLLIVADAHNGHTAATVAVTDALEYFGDDPPPELDDKGWLALFERLNDAVIAKKGLGSKQPASNTVLIIALVAGGKLHFGSMGDAALVLARPGETRGRQLNQEAMRFVGYPMKRRGLKSAMHRGSINVDDDQWVVLVSDGLSEFIGPLRPADVLPKLVAGAGSPEAAALAIVDLANESGAGDNVAVAVLAPG